MVNRLVTGMESSYWKMDQYTGIKVIRTPFRIPNCEGYAMHAQEEALYRSSKWKEAQRQFGIMQELAKRKRAPAPVEIAIIVDDRGTGTGVGTFFYPAIIMEHINFTSQSHCKDWRTEKAFTKFLRILGKKYSVQDTHPDNVIWSQDKKRFMLLDMGGVSKL